MARKTFISYKYSEARRLRDIIIKALGSDATYYQGEYSDSPYIGDLKTDTIKKKLADMIFSTSVMIVIISENVDQSEWIEWEINYATTRQTRNGIQSQPNGIVMVIKDSLIRNNKYTPNKIIKLIKDKSDPVVVSLSGFLKNPSNLIEKAYNKASHKKRMI